MKKWIVIISVFPSALLGITCGSDSAISRDSFFVFPKEDADNEIKGFCVMDGGFALEDSTTTCTFNAFFPVHNRVELNGGLLYLKLDLILDNITTFTSLGNIRAPMEGRKFQLPPSLKQFGIVADQSVTFENIELILQSDVTLDCPITFEGNSKIIGLGKIFSLGNSGNIIVAPGSSLILQDIVMSNVKGTRIRCADDTAELVLNKLKWLQSGLTTFTTGSLLIQDRVDFIGTTTFVYESHMTATIDTDSEWRFSNNILFQMGHHPVNMAEPLAFKDVTSVISMDNCSFIITNQGMHLTKGMAKFLRTVSFEFQSTNTQTGVIIGDGYDPANDFVIEFAPAAVLNFNKGHFIYNCVDPNCVKSKTKTARVVRGEQSNIYNARTQTLSKFTFEYASALVPSIVVEAGQTVAFDDIRIALPDVSFDITGQQYSAVAELLPGNSSLSINKGSVPLGLLILNTGNTIRGNGTYGGPIIFLSPTAAATWSVNGTLNSSITFNGATLTLGADLFLDPSAVLAGPGTINLNGLTFHFTPNVTTCNTAITWQGEGKLNLRNRVNVTNTWTIKDKVTIEGQNHILDLTSGNIVVDTDGQLILKDVILEGLSGTNLRCTDDTGSIIFDSTTNYLAADYTFANGGMQYKNKNRFLNNKIFAYQSVMTSTVLSEATLKFDHNITFSYDPSDGTKNLLEFTDGMSHLILNNSTLHTTLEGMQFNKGELIIKGESFIASETEETIDANERTVLKDEGIIFGDGLLSNNDFKCTIVAGAFMKVSNGSIRYKNKSANSIVMGSHLSMIHMFSDTRLRLHQSLTLADGTIQFDDKSYLMIECTKKLQASIVPKGTLFKEKFIE